MLHRIHYHISHLYSAFYPSESDKFHNQSSCMSEVSYDTFSPIPGYTIPHKYKRYSKINTTNTYLKPTQYTTTHFLCFYVFCAIHFTNFLFFSSYDILISRLKVLSMQETIECPEYINQLINYREKKLIKIVTGFRRCGKSTLTNLLELIFDQYYWDKHLY